MSATAAIFGQGPAPGTEVSPVLVTGKKDLGSALGFGEGDALNSQLEAEILERRKRALITMNQPPSAFGAVGFGTGLNVGAGVAMQSPAFPMMNAMGFLGGVRG